MTISESDIVTALERHIAEFSGPFVWGVRDCVIFSGRWAETILGRTILDALPRWRDEAGARAVQGDDDLGDLVTAALGIEPVGACAASVGDIVLGQNPEALGIVTGGGDAVFLSLHSGPWSRSLSRCSVCWRITTCLQ